MIRRLRRSALSVGCHSLPPNSTCDAAPCSEGRICDDATKLCLANPLPQVVITAPNPAVRVTQAQVELRGTATDNTTVKKVEVRVGDGGWAPIKLSEGAFAVQLSLPEVDQQALPITVRATDDFGAQGETTVTPPTDTRSPTFTFEPANGTRGAIQTAVTVRFSEPVTATGSGITITPSVDGGAWDPTRSIFVARSSRRTPGTR